MWTVFKWTNNVEKIHSTILWFSGAIPLRSYHIRCGSVECSSALGLQDGSLPNSSLTAGSAKYGAAADARLNSSVGWAGNYTHGEWLQVELGNVTNVTAIATQGHPRFNWWSRRYLLYSSFDGIYWQPYRKVRGEFHSSSPAILGFLWSPWNADTSAPSVPL